MHPVETKMTGIFNEFLLGIFNEIHRETLHNSFVMGVIYDRDKIRARGTFFSNALLLKRTLVKNER